MGVKQKVPAVKPHSAQDSFSGLFPFELGGG